MGPARTGPTEDQAPDAGGESRGRRSDGNPEPAPSGLEGPLLDGRGAEYPENEIRVAHFDGDLASIYFPPIARGGGDWPSDQLNYLSKYLGRVGCKSVLIEAHYVDRDYISDLSLFYARSLRSYPNYCQRIHFFRNDLTLEGWLEKLSIAGAGRIAEVERELQRDYLGFSVVRPLPSSPIGRTVIATFPPTVDARTTRQFGCTREYDVSLAGFRLRVEGLAFQQQDRGVSACATTALWCALHRAAEGEGLYTPTPAEITESASRYFLASGRPLPSEGLTVYQICEAIRAAGLAPALIPAGSAEADRANLLGYTASGFPPVLVLLQPGAEEGHAVCAVGVKLGPPRLESPDVHYLEAASGVQGVYVHDDRLGPYASASLTPFTLQRDETSEASRRGDPPQIRTQVTIKWPGEDVPAFTSLLHAMVVPVPVKVRLPLPRLRLLGMAIAEAVGEHTFPRHSRRISLSCGYRLGRKYQREAYGFGLSENGLVDLTCRLVLSRYVGLIELTVDGAALLDVVFDATEAIPESSMTCIVRRASMDAAETAQLDSIAARYGAELIS